MVKQCEHPKYVEIDLDEVVNQILSSKSESHKSNDFVDNLYLKLKNNPPKKTLKFVHIADAHLDFKY